MTDRIRNEITIQGQDVINLVLRQLHSDREHLRATDKLLAADLKHLASSGHVSVKLDIPVPDELTAANDFSLTFCYDVTPEEYSEATAQVVCVVCKQWSAFTKELNEGEVCDFCRAKKAYDSN